MMMQIIDFILLSDGVCLSFGGTNYKQMLRSSALEYSSVPSKIGGEPPIS